MDKFVVRWSYWIAILLTVMAIIARLFGAIGGSFLYFVIRGGSVGYHAYLDGAMLFFLVEIGTAAYARLNSQSTGR